MVGSKRIIMQLKIQELKEQGLTKTEIINHFIEKKEIPPSWPTVAKYYDMEASESSGSKSPFAKDRAFDAEPYRSVVIEILKRNNEKLRISSIFDVLQEQFVDTGIVVALPGNEQTLRNFVHWLRTTNQVPQPQEKKREYDFVEGLQPGEQLIVDFGEQKIADGLTIHFLCLLLRYSKFLFVVVQDHKFNSSEACRGIHLCFKRIGGRVVTLVIDQDSVFIYEEKYGEIIETQVFKAFLNEQDLKLFVCRKADPESKGMVEKSVQFVKQNYFSARDLHTLHEVKNGIASWMNRKNARINPVTLKIPAEELLVEQPRLRPLVPSLYSMIEQDYTIYEVNSMAFVRYKTNRYSVPKTYRFQKVKYKVVNDVLHIYDITSGERIAQHELDSRKGIIATLPEHKRQESTAWQATATSIKVKYWCRSMEHFINGICKENPRYKSEQLQAVERFLDNHRPVDPTMLERVLGTCCERFAYHFSEFEFVYQEIAESNRISDCPLFASETLPEQAVKVQQRTLDSYGKAVSRMATQGQAGGQS